MDNTVIDIDDRYVLKIYETKTSSFVKSSLNNYQRFKRFYCIDLINGKNGNEIVFYCKPTNVLNQNTELKIIYEYINITGFYENNELMALYNILNLISCYRGLLMALSTEYYCFEKQKFLPEVMDTFFLKKVLSLANNAKCRLKELKNVKRSHKDTSWNLWLH